MISTLLNVKPQLKFLEITDHTKFKEDLNAIQGFTWGYYFNDRGKDLYNYIIRSNKTLDKLTSVRVELEAIYTALRKGMRYPFSSDLMKKEIMYYDYPEEYAESLHDIFYDDESGFVDRFFKEESRFVDRYFEELYEEYS